MKLYNSCITKIDAAGCNYVFVHTCNTYMYICNDNKEKGAINLREHGRALGKGWREERWV